MGKRELVALLNLSSWCLVVVARLFLAVPWDCLRFVNVVFPDHTHLLFLVILDISMTFDRVLHQRLLAKTYHYGIQGQTYKWIESLLSNRRQ